MREVEDFFGPVWVYTPDEAAEKFVPLRDRIFAMYDGFRGRYGDCVFRDDSWTKVIIRGSLTGSDRTDAALPPAMDDEESLEWAKDDPRSELQPLFDLLVEDGISEVIHMYPGLSNGREDAVVTRPTYNAISSQYHYSHATRLQERLLFDETKRWGFYGSEEEFGLLSGEPFFMARYIERVGGMDFIREKADAYWQLVLDDNSFEARYVANYYKLAGWDNPPVKKDSGD